MTMHRLLMIDDEPDYFDQVRAFLDEDLYLIQHEVDPIKGVETAKQNPPDLVILDILMESLDGFGVVRRLQQHDMTSNIPIVFYSIVGDEDETNIRGLGLGIDHIVYKGRKGALQLLEATIERLLTRRNKKKTRSFRVEGHQLVLQGDEAERVWRDDRELTLSRHQRVILARLAVAEGDFLSTEDLCQLLYGDLLEEKDWRLDLDMGRFYKFIHDLRARVEPDPGHPIFIANDRGMGYRLLEGEQ